MRTRGQLPMIGVLLAAAIAAATTGSNLTAQTPAGLRYQFEVASIRASIAADNNNRVGPTPQGGLRGTNVTPLQLIAQAYGVRPFLVVDAPDWVSSQRFDIEATTDVAEELPPNSTGQQREAFTDRVRQRLQKLLQDRFGLVVRTETRSMPAYDLVVANGGHKMVAATGEQSRRMESNSTRRRIRPDQQYSQQSVINLG